MVRVPTSTPASVASSAVWFDFAALCDGPRSQTDYLWLARQYHTVILSDVPVLTAKEASAARRLTWLVDDVSACVRFFTDFGLALVEQTGDSALFGMTSEIALRTRVSQLMRRFP